MHTPLSIILLLTRVRVNETQTVKKNGRIQNPFVHHFQKEKKGRNLNTSQRKE